MKLQARIGLHSQSRYHAIDYFLVEVKDHLRFVNLSGNGQGDFGGDIAVRQGVDARALIRVLLVCT